MPSKPLLGVLLVVLFLAIYQTVAVYWLSTQVVRLSSTVSALKPTLTSTVPLPTPASISATSVSSLSLQLADIKQELAKIRAEQRGLNQVLGTATSPDQVSTMVSSLSITPTTTAVSYVSAPAPVTVYPQKSFTTQTVGQTQANTKYPVISTDGSWYQITLAPGKTGWVTSPIISTSP